MKETVKIDFLMIFSYREEKTMKHIRIILKTPTRIKKRNQSVSSNKYLDWLYFNNETRVQKKQ